MPWGPPQARRRPPSTGTCRSTELSGPPATLASACTHPGCAGPAVEEVGEIVPDARLPRAGPAPLLGRGASPRLSAPTAHRVRSVLAIPAFRRLWLVTAVSATGDWLSLLALSALATQLATGYQAQSFALGGVVATKLLPALVLGPLAGALADKFDRRRVMVVCDLLRFGLFLSIPLVGSLWWLLVATLLIEMCALFWIPAKDASVPNLLRRPDQVETANQLALVMTYGVAVITASGLFTVISGLGAFLPGSTPAISTAYVALVLNGLAYLLTATTVWFRIREISGPGAAAPRGRARAVRPAARRRALRGRHAAGPRARRRHRRGVHRGRHRRRLGHPVRRQPGRRERRLRDAVHRGVRRAGARDGRRAAAGAAAAAQPAVRHGDRRRGLRAGARRARPAPHGGDRRRRPGRRLRRDRLPHRPDDHRRRRSRTRCAGASWRSCSRSCGSRCSARWRWCRCWSGWSARGPCTCSAIRSVIDGTRIVMLAGGLVAAVVGMLAYRQMDDRRTEPLLPDLLAALRRGVRRSGSGVLIAVEGATAAETAAQAAAAGRGAARARARGGPGRSRRSCGPSSVTPASLSGARAGALAEAAARADLVERVVRPALDGRRGRRGRPVPGQPAGRARGGRRPDARRAGRPRAGEPRRVRHGPAAPGRLRAARPRPPPRPPGDAADETDVAPDPLPGEEHLRVRRLLTRMAAAEPHRYVVVDADGAPDDVADRVLAALAPVLPAPAGTGRRDAAGAVDASPPPEPLVRAGRATRRTAGPPRPSPSRAPGPRP